MNAKISVFLIYVELIKYLLYNLLGCTFKLMRKLHTRSSSSESKLRCAFILASVIFANSIKRLSKYHDYYYKYYCPKL